MPSKSLHPWCARAAARLLAGGVLALVLASTPALAQSGPVVHVGYPYDGAVFSAGTKGTIVVGDVSTEGQPLPGLYVQVTNLTAGLATTAFCTGPDGNFFVPEIRLVAGDNLLRISFTDATAAAIDCGCEVSTGSPSAGYPIEVDMTVTLDPSDPATLIRDTRDDVDVILATETLSNRDRHRLERASDHLTDALATMSDSCLDDTFKSVRLAIKELDKYDPSGALARRPIRGVSDLWSDVFRLGKRRIGPRQSTQMQTIEDLNAQAQAETDEERRVQLYREATILMCDLINEAPHLLALEVDPSVATSTARIDNFVTGDTTASTVLSPSTYGSAEVAMLSAGNARAVIHDRTAKRVMLVDVETGTTLLSLTLTSSARLAASAAGSEFAVAESGTGAIRRFDAGTGTELGSVVPASFAAATKTCTDVQAMAYDPSGTILALQITGVLVSFTDLTGTVGEAEVAMSFTAASSRNLAWRSDGTSVYLMSAARIVHEVSAAGVVATATGVAGDTDNILLYFGGLDLLGILAIPPGYPTGTVRPKISLRSPADLDVEVYRVCIGDKVSDMDLDNIAMLYDRDVIVRSKNTEEIVVVDCGTGGVIELFNAGATPIPLQAIAGER